MATEICPPAYRDWGNARVGSSLGEIPSYLDGKPVVRSNRPTICRYICK